MSTKNKFAAAMSVAVDVGLFGEQAAALDYEAAHERLRRVLLAAGMYTRNDMVSFAEWYSEKLRRARRNCPAAVFMLEEWEAEK